jgi:hypothetical protein
MVCELLKRRNRNGIISSFGMNLRQTFSQEIRRSLLQRSLLLLEVERGRGEPSLQLQLINPLHLLSLGKLRKNWISVMIQGKKNLLQEIKTS